MSLTRTGFWTCCHSLPALLRSPSYSVSTSWFRETSTCQSGPSASLNPSDGMSCLKCPSLLSVPKYLGCHSHLNLSLRKNRLKQSGEMNLCDPSWMLSKLRFSFSFFKDFYLLMRERAREREKVCRREAQREEERRTPC